MKKIILSLVIALSSYCSYAQTWSGSTPGNIYYNFGNVGIGTTSPGLKLEINGAVGAPATTGTTQTGITRISNSSLVSVLDIGEFGSAPWGAWLQATDYSNLQNTHPLVFNPNGGNVGIGTINPILPLQVKGAIYSESPIGNTAVVGTTTAGNQTYNFLGYQGYWGLRTANNLSYNLDVFNNGSPITTLSVLQSGNVLIGQTTQVNPVYKLDVKGKTRADEIVVNTSGADFVFARKYVLPKLTDVKAYIDKNQHLPEIPSAKEMQTNGMSVGEINTKLLQKVEELTLYLIDKDKQLTEQQKQIEHLKQKNTQIQLQQQQIDELKTQVAKLLKQQ